jgi:hypothetical protein
MTKFSIGQLIARSKIVSGETLITFLLSESNYDAEVEVIKEMKPLAGKTLVVAQRVRDRARAAADIVVELDCDLPEPPCEPDPRGSSRRWSSR